MPRAQVETVKLSTLSAARFDGKKFTKEEREDIRAKVADMRLRGLTFKEIGAALNVPLSYAYNEYKVVESRWRHAANESLVQLKAQELARIDMVEAEAWRAYERSQKNANEQHQEYSHGANGERSLDVTKARTKGRDGDSRFLAIILDCVDRRIKLLGLDSDDLRGAAAVVNTASDNQSVADRLSRYQGILGVAIVGISGQPDDPARLGESVDSPRPPSEASPVFDADGWVRDSTP